MLTVSREAEPALGDGGAKPAAVRPAARRRPQREGHRRVELPVAHQGGPPTRLVAVPLPVEVAEHGLAAVDVHPPAGRARDRRQRVPGVRAHVSHGQTPRRADDQVGGGVGGDQHAHPASHLRERRAGVVEPEDLPVGPALPSGAVRAVLRHAVAVAEAVAADREGAALGHPVGLVDADRCGRRRRSLPAGRRARRPERATRPRPSCVRFATWSLSSQAPVLAASPRA